MTIRKKETGKGPKFEKWKRSKLWKRTKELLDKKRFKAKRKTERGRRAKLLDFDWGKIAKNWKKDEQFNANRLSTLFANWH